jgi:hypothetical protein
MPPAEYLPIYAVLLLVAAIITVIKRIQTGSWFFRNSTLPPCLRHDSNERNPND